MITLALDAESARFADGDALALGPARLVRDWLRHDPPTGAELEAAIEAVEDLVMPLHGRWVAEPGAGARLSARQPMFTTRAFGKRANGS